MWKKSLVPHNTLQGLLASIALIVCLGAPVQVIADASKEVKKELREAAKAVRVEDYARAYKLYSAIAANGYSEAQFQLATLYGLGKGVEKNAAKERFWLEKAAANQHAPAQYSLALLIQQDDPTRSNQFIQEAAAQGFAPAKLYIQRQGEAPLPERKAQLDTDERWFAAARKNQLDTLQTMRNEMADIDVLDQQGRTALTVAVQAGSAEVVAWLLKQGADPAKRDRFDKAIGFVAIDNKQLNLLSTLMKAGLDPNQTLKNGDTLLHYAVRRGNAKAVSRLLNKGTNINAQNKDGWTALDLARFAKQAEIEQRLKQQGARYGEGWQQPKSNASTNMAKQWTGDKPLDGLQLATIVNAGNATLLRQMAMQHRNLINQPLPDGTSLLAIAIANGQQPVVDVLLELGANPNGRVNGELTALQWAARYGQDEIALALLAKGASLTAKSKDEGDAIELALENGHTQLATALFDAFRKKGPKSLTADRYVYTAAKVEAVSFIQHIAPQIKSLYRDKRGHSALWFAANHSDAELIKLLQTKGLYDDQPDEIGKTPLFIAVERGCVACLQQLAKKADLNRTSPNGDTVLILAASKGDQDMVKALIDLNVDVHVRNTLGDSALLAAVRASDADVVRALVDAGASVSRKNKMGLSARDIAKLKGPEMEEALATR